MINTPKRGWENRREGPGKSECFDFVTVAFTYFLAEKQKPLEFSEATHHSWELQLRVF